MMSESAAKDTKFSKDNQPTKRNDGEAVTQRNKRRPIMTDALMLALNEEVDECAETGKKTKRLRLIANKLAERASKGDVKAIQLVFDRTEGKAAQAIIHQGDEDNPLVYSNLTDAQLEAKIKTLLEG